MKKYSPYLNFADKEVIDHMVLEDDDKRMIISKHEHPELWAEYEASLLPVEEAALELETDKIVEEEAPKPKKGKRKK